MDRCALFVDAGYLLADGAMAVHGTRNRDSVSWDYSGLMQLLTEVASDRTGLPLLRCYWYEATADGRRTQEQDGIADIPGIKFRAASIRPGRREGVESYVQRDVLTLARTGVLCDAVLVSGDEDMAQVVSEVQDLGVRVTVVHISVEGNWTISRALRRECDDLIEIGVGHLRPHVTLLSGAAAGDPTVDTTMPMGNGHGHSVPSTVRQPVAAHAGSARPEPAPVPVPAAEPMYDTGTQGRVPGSAMEQLRAMQQSIAAQQRGDHLAPQNGGIDPSRTPSGPVDANGFPTGGRPHPPAPQQPPMGGTPPAGANPGFPNPSTGPNPSFANPSTGPNPSFRNPSTGPNPSFANPSTGPNQSFANPANGAARPYGDPASGPAPNMHDQRQGGYGPGPHTTGAHRDPLMGGGTQYERDIPPSRGTPPGQDPRYGPNTGENPGYGGNSGPNPTYGVSTGTESGARSAAAHTGFGSPTGPRPDHSVQHGPYTSPTPRVDYVAPGAAATRSAEEAVRVARKEGSDFAESIARDAPMLWLEAVLARRPRMPSDLEARLLQGSALPIDFLLRDEVRDALREGFWDALERART
ncbi:NYN domain-containing protein [Murinocardiopsis flavida]|uniref:NYN domain-containing protein n=1 Tax=Murinocardiopsis flavida TaxID=645275 RepID=A0A2P8DGF8_9ACTN|nr:NYN domain-containing protein [Murinocardiopsis flavida]PSK96314.1 NYN domain-containing protein [Murinocardiopsis flavida]